MIDGRYDNDDRVSTTVALRLMLISDPGLNFVVEYNIPTCESAFIVLASQHQLNMLCKYGKKLISIDSTHKTQQYGLHLTTIVVQDAAKEGYAVAACLSPKRDEATWLAFFEAIKGRIGGPLQTETFLSDDDNSFYNAWSRCMGVPEKRLCSWHVIRAWGGHLNGIPEIKKTGLLDRLKSLLNCQDKIK